MFTKRKRRWGFRAQYATHMAYCIRETQRERHGRARAMQPLLNREWRQRKQLTVAPALTAPPAPPPHTVYAQEPVCSVQVLVTCIQGLLAKQSLQAVLAIKPHDSTSTSTSISQRRTLTLKKRFRLAFSTIQYARCWIYMISTPFSTP